jgi:hypothetical protein
MKRHELKIGTVIILEDNLVEVIAKEGLEITLEILREFRQFITDNTQHPVGLLVNKQHAYTYTYETQASIGNTDIISCVALLVYSRIAEITTYSMFSTIATPNYKTKFFWDRSSAINWLNETIQL